MESVTVIGAGLAGSECAWQLAQRGIPVVLREMKPEKKMPQDSIEAWAKIGVPEEWVYVLRKAGFNLLSDICGEKAQGLQQKLGEINKKYKLGYEKPSVDEIQRWIDAVTPAETEA